MSIVIRNGIIVTSSKSYLSDIKIVDEKIVEIAEHIDCKESEIIDASGCFIFPGFIDAHTHFDMNNGNIATSDDFYSGTKAAIKGGTTTIIDFATQDKGKTLMDALNVWRGKAKDKSNCDYGFHMAITDWNEDTKKELKNMIDEGISSFKVYLAYDNLRVNDEELYEILESMKEIKGLLGIHCENGDLVNARCKELLAKGKKTPKYHPISRADHIEAEAISRVLHIATIVGVPVNIVHLSTKLGLDEVIKAKKSNENFFVETCPQYLLLDDDKYTDDIESCKYVCSPPLRKKIDNIELWKGIQDGNINTIATDHCSFNYTDKKEYAKKDFTKIPNGMPGVENRAELIYTYGVKTGKISKEKMCALLSENSAKIFGLFPQKGIIREGSDADLVIWQDVSDAISNETQVQNVDYTPYEGVKIFGKARDVFLRGKHIVKNGKVVLEGLGKYVSRKEIYNG